MALLTHSGVQSPDFIKEKVESSCISHRQTESNCELSGKAQLTESERVCGEIKAVLCSERQRKQALIGKPPASRPPPPPKPSSLSLFSTATREAIALAVVPVSYKE